MYNNRYLLVCDERGTSLWPDRRKTWALGGFIVHWNKAHLLISSWDAIKVRLCGDQSAELKWSHFFSGHHQSDKPNPLKSQDPQQWREQALWAMSELFTSTMAIPFTTLVRKDKASAELFTTSKKGRTVLDTDSIWTSLFAQFALFLTQHAATGEVWHDQIASRKDESHRQTQWEQIHSGSFHNIPGGLSMLQRIDKQIRFLDSKAEPLVQIADFISGAIWADSENDSQFLLQHLEHYFPLGIGHFNLVRII